MSIRTDKTRAHSETSSRAFGTIRGRANSNNQSDDRNEEEIEEITRCICGREEINDLTINSQVADILESDFEIKIDQGLFIQCEQCSVWQHGYCVGLFTDEDVPEKYYCEECKPELHFLMHEGRKVVRSLYKGPNEKRNSLLELYKADSAPGTAKLRSRRLESEPKTSRKEIRHYDEEYDVQLQKALRESAREFGIDYEKEPERATRKRNRSDDNSESAPTKKEEINFDGEEDTKLDSEQKRLKPKSKNTARPVSMKASSRSKIKRRTDKVENPKSETTASNDAIVNQKSKPRFVSNKASLYELRKRTGAILEWLGRTQIELEEDRASKVEIFSYKENLSEDSLKNQEEYKRILVSFNENLQSMEKLTEKIIQWEDNFGKYAP